MRINDLLKSLLATCFVVLLAITLDAQDCVTIESGTYTGETKKGAFDTYGTATSVSFTKVGDDQLKISDFSAGFLSSFGRATVEITLTINCDGSVDPIEFKTEAGQTSITGGTYSGDGLTLNWEIPFNEVVEESVFTKN